ncbi:MAG: hypothetical protein N2508_06180 [Anaerolineae bacterium]|nr:hypothetical protein [Anaerolineae bacterium]
MVETFWENIGEALAKEWTARVLAPAFAFWGGGLLAFAARYGWELLNRWWTACSAPEQVALLVGGLLLIAFSGVVMEWAQDGVLRLAEGYWPFPFRWLRFALARRWEKKTQRMEERWQALADQCGGDPARLSPPEQVRYARLDSLRLRLPADPGRMMPTLIGNLLRGAEEYPWIRYGLAADVCWPRLWLLLPHDAREELTAARGRLNETARLLAWGLLFIVWTVWAWWAAPVGLLVALLASRGMVLAALTYGDLIRTAFDLYHPLLYQQLGWPEPKGPADGRRLTEYLARGKIR